MHGCGMPGSGYISVRFWGHGGAVGPRRGDPHAAGAVLDSSMVEHTAVNRGVVGSSPTRGVRRQRDDAQEKARKH